MSITLNVNGINYSYPEQGDTNWGAGATDWASAITTGTLQKAGGLFQILSELDFGSAGGLKSLYYKSRTANPATAGQIRLARADVISFRNEANDANLDLSVNSSNELLFNGVSLAGVATVTDTNSIDMVLTGTDLAANVKLSAAAAGAGFLKNTLTIEADGLLIKTPIADTSTTGVLSDTDWDTFNNKQPAGSYLTALTGDVVATGPGSAAAAIQSGVITNAMINASAAIAYSKLNLSNSIVNADVNASAAIAYSKLNLSNSIVNADVNASAAIEYSKLDLTGGIISTDVAAGAAIEYTKLEVLTAQRALVSSGAGYVAAASLTTATEIGYVSGVTSAIQTQLDTKMANPMTTGGDLIYGGASGVPTRLANGSSGQFLKSNGTTTAPSWATVGGANMATLKDVKAANTNGGTATSGSFFTRTLNTLVDPFSIVTSLSSNQFVLPAGTYRINAGAPGFACGRIKIKLRNITDSTDTSIGMSVTASSADNVVSTLTEVFTIAGSKTFEIQQRVETTQASNGQGVASNLGVDEIYATVEIQKLL